MVVWSGAAKLVASFVVSAYQGLMDHLRLTLAVSIWKEDSLQSFLELAILQKLFPLFPYQLSRRGVRIQSLFSKESEGLSLS